MSILCSFCLISFVSVFLSVITDKKTEEIVFTLSLSTIIILFLFYCNDLLFAGRMTVYALLLTLLIIAIIIGVRKSMLSVKKILSSISPSLIIFAIIGVVAFFYTDGHKVGMWDELRLWGAVPKALYETESLQLGSNVDIFPIMQSYPPAMPLFVYFFVSLSSSFNESNIFCLYVIFYALIFLPGFKKLEWKHWYFILPLVITILFFPCIFTSHNLNYSLFYNSLYIDTVLGFYAGYGFYLSFNNPFKNKYALADFCVVLSVIVLLKDSGLMFSIFIFLCAIVIYAFHNKPFYANRIISLSSVCILASVLPYIIWKHTISSYGIVNHLSMHIELPDINYFIALLDHFIHDVFIVLSFRSLPTIIVRFIPCILFAIIADIFIFTYYKDTDVYSDVTVVISMVVSSIFFIIGYCFIFLDGSFPSFQRYMATLLYTIFTYLLLRFINACIENYEYKNISLNKRRIASLIVTCASALSLIVFIPFFSDWRDSKVDNIYWPDLYSNSSKHTTNILNTLDNSSDDAINLYLLLSDGNALLHHRIYYDLIGEKIDVKNFYHHCQGVPIGTEIPVDDDKKLQEIVSNWSEYLKENKIDYIYVTLSSEETSAIFNHISNSPIAASESIYEVKFDNNELILNKVD